jgi:hypothetical protein
VSRLDDLIELREALRPQVLAQHSEHGLQGVSGLVGQYLKTLAEIEELEARTPTKGTVLDELAKRRAESKPAPRPRRPARRAQ